MKLIVNHKRAEIKRRGEGEAGAKTASRRIDEFARAAKLRVYVAYNTNKVRFISIARQILPDIRRLDEIDLSPLPPLSFARSIENLITIINIRALDVVFRIPESPPTCPIPPFVPKFAK